MIEWSAGAAALQYLGASTAQLLQALYHCGPIRSQMDMLSTSNMSLGRSSVRIGVSSCHRPSGSWWRADSHFRDRQQAIVCMLQLHGAYIKPLLADPSCLEVFQARAL